MKINRLPRFDMDVSCCFYDNMATICNCYGESINWMFYDFLNIEYSKGSLDSLKLMHSKRQMRLKWYYGFNCVEKKYETNLIDRLKEVLDHGIIVMYKTYLYYCPGNWAYHRAGLEKNPIHFYIVEECCDERKAYKYTDPYSQKEESYISYEDAIPGYISHVEITKPGNGIKKDGRFLDRQLEELNCMSYWDSLFELTEDLFLELKANCDWRDGTAESIKYWDNVERFLRSLRDRCYYFAVYLIFLSEHKNDRDYKRLGASYIEAFNLWENIRLMFVKFSQKKIKDKGSLEKIRTRMVEATSWEKDLLRELFK